MGVLKRTGADCIVVVPHGEWHLPYDLGYSLELPILRFHAKHFTDGELSLRCPELVVVKDKDIVLFAPQRMSPSDIVLGVAFFAQVLKQSQAKSIIAVIPYFPYARQERSLVTINKPAPLQMVVSLLKVAGVTNIVSVWFNAVDSIRNLPVPVLTVSPRSLLVDEILYHKLNVADPCLVAMNVRTSSIVREIAQILKLQYVIYDKQRVYDNAVSGLKVNSGTGSDRGTAILFDDVIATGTTATRACRDLTRYGFSKVYGFFLHPLLYPGALEKIEKSDFKKVFFPNSMMLPVIADSLKERVVIMDAYSVIEKAVKSVLLQCNIRFGPTP